MDVTALVLSVLALVVSILSAVYTRGQATEAKRANDRNDGLDRDELNERIRAGLVIREERHADGFYFENGGREPVWGLTVVDPPDMLDGAPRGVDLDSEGGRSERFTLWPPKPRPEFLKVAWDGQPSPVKIEFPYDVMDSVF